MSLNGEGRRRLSLVGALTPLRVPCDFKERWIHLVTIQELCRRAVHRGYKVLQGLEIIKVSKIWNMFTATGRVANGMLDPSGPA